MSWIRWSRSPLLWLAKVSKMLLRANVNSEHQTPTYTSMKNRQITHCLQELRFLWQEAIGLISGTQREFIEISQTVKASDTFANKSHWEPCKIVEGMHILKDDTILLLIGYLCKSSQAIRNPRSPGPRRRMNPLLGVDSGGRPESEGSEEGRSWVNRMRGRG